MTGQSALPERSEKFRLRPQRKTRIFWQKESTAECANNPHIYLPVVVLGASPLKIGAFFPAKNSAKLSGRAQEIEGGIARDCSCRLRVQ